MRQGPIWLLCAVILLVTTIQPALAAKPDSGGMASAMNGAFASALEQEATEVPGAEEEQAPAWRTFEPAAQVSRDLKARFLDQLLQQMPADKRPQARQAFAGINILELLRPVMAEYGMDINDLSVATTLWAVTALNILQGDSSDHQDQMVWRQFRQVMAENPDTYRAYSNTQKQKAAESLYWMSAFMQFDYDMAKQGTPGFDMGKVKDYVRTMLKERGLDPARVEITDRGLTAKGGAGAEGLGQSSGAPASERPEAAQAAASHSAGQAEARENARPHDSAGLNVGLEPYHLPAPYEALLCHSETEFVGTSLRLATTIYLLLEDGSVYQGLEEPLERFDAARKRRREPQQWGDWERTGEGYRLRIPDAGGDWQAFTDESLFKPALVNEKLDRAVEFGSATGDAFMGGSVSIDNWRFDRSGRFARGASSLYGSGTLGRQASGVSTRVYRNEDEDGESAVVSSTGSGFAVGSQQEKDGGADNRGHYRLAGHTLRLTYDNGETEDELFGYCNNRANTFIGDTFYWMEDSAAEDEFPVNWDDHISLAEQRYFVPEELARGAVFRVSVAPRQRLNGEPFAEWFKQSTQEDVAGLGAPQGQGPISTEGHATRYIQPFRDDQGRTLIAVYHGAPLHSDNEPQGRYLRIVTSDPKLVKTYISDLKPVIETTFSQ